MGFHRGKGPAGPVHAVRRTGQPGPRFNYELFNHNNFNIRYWSWNYRGCWPLPSGASPLSGRPPAASHDGCYSAGPRFHGGLARTLSPGTDPGTDTLACSTQAVTALLGISVGSTALSLPRPRLSRRCSPVTHEHSTSRLFTEGGYFWRQRTSTRLALQLFLVKGFKLYSFQLQDPKEPCISIYCHYLPVSGLGNLRACCLPWM